MTVPLDAGDRLTAGPVLAHRIDAAPQRTAPASALERPRERPS